MSPDEPAEDDGDLLADETPAAMANHNGYFANAQESLEAELREVIRQRGSVLEDTPGFVPGRYLLKAIKCASWASHEDLRQTRHRMVAATLRVGQRIVATSKEGAEGLVREIRELKEASDLTAKKLVRVTWFLAWGTIVLALSTMALVLVEASKH